MHFDWATFWVFYSFIAVLLYVFAATARLEDHLVPLLDHFYLALGSALWPMFLPAMVKYAQFNLWAYRPINNIKLTPDEGGYWLIKRDGVFPFGNAHEHVLKDSVWGENKEDPGIYFAPDGRVYTRGEITFCGGVADRELQAPIVVGLLTRSRQGYWLVGADGGVFAFGDAKFYGSLGHAPADYNVNWKPAKWKGSFTFADAKPFLTQPEITVVSAKVDAYGGMDMA